MDANNYIGYNGYYDVCKKAQEKREKIPQSVARGFIHGIIAQFLANVFFSIFFSENNILENDIEISPISQYYAAAAAGAIGGYSGIYVDRFALVAITNVFYVFVNNYVDTLINQTDFNISTDDLIFDIVATELILLLLDKKAVNDHINHMNEKHHINAEPLETKRGVGESIFISIVTNAFFEFKRSYVEATGNAGAVSVGVETETETF